MHYLLLVALSATLYTNAYWWNGESFSFGERYVEDGYFVETSSDVVNTVDLGGNYVLPPLADAHNHNLQNPYLAERFAQRYINSGILYGAMLCGDPESAKATETLLAEKKLDILVAGACVSSSDGHPLRMAMGGLGESAQVAPEAIYDKSYIVVDTVKDIAAKQPLFAQAGGRLTKLILVHHEDSTRRGDKTYFGVNGLRPEVVAPLVQAAHRRNQIVVVHTESAADFSLAVNAGADWIGHLPGYHWHAGKSAAAYRLSDSSVQRAAARDIAVIPTASVVSLFKMDARQRAEVQKLQAENLSKLREAGVTLLAGSDLFMGSVIDELIYLQQFDFTARELLNIATQVTPKKLFPQRAIGRLANGFEASFVSYTKDPLTDLEVLRTPQRVIKKGVPLHRP